jgi:hypothetical protein
MGKDESPLLAKGAVVALVEMKGILIDEFLFRFIPGQV